MLIMMGMTPERATAKKMPQSLVLRLSIVTAFFSFPMTSTEMTIMLGMIMSERKLSKMKKRESVVFIWLKLKTTCVSKYFSMQCKAGVDIEKVNKAAMTRPERTNNVSCTALMNLLSLLKSQ